MRQREVVSSDGMTLAAYDAGNASGPEILFIHGFSQCAVYWNSQFSDPVLKEHFRLAAFDIRGHGASEKPSEPERYAENRQFAADVNAVMDALDLKHPVLSDGPMPGASSAIILRPTAQPASPASTTFAREPTIARNSPGRGMNISPACWETTQLLSSKPRAILSVPVSRSSPRPRSSRRSSLTTCWFQPTSAPRTLVLKGLGELTAALIPGAKLSMYEGIGHSPFAEDALRFNRELAEFATVAHARQF